MTDYVNRHYVRANKQTTMHPGDALLVTFKDNPGDPHDGGPYAYAKVKADLGERVLCIVVKSDHLRYPVGSGHVVPKVDVYREKIDTPTQLRLEL